MAFVLPSLDYSYDALKDVIDEMTMRIHHVGHHAAYVNKLNEILTGYPEFLERDISDLVSNILKLPDSLKEGVRNNGGGHWNHSFFWKILTPNRIEPSDRLLAAIEKRFGSFEKFKELFKQTALNRFGSGWAWLIKDKNGDLIITSTPNQDNPLMEFSEVRGKPILGIDLWEHAYYLKYQNRRGEYVDAFWNIVNWDMVDRLLFIE